MSRDVVMQFVGFEVKGLFREYTFSVREPPSDARQFTLTIPNEAFDQHRVRYQDAPDVCSLKLRRELATYANNPPDTHYGITDAELEDYRSSHSRAPKSPFARKPVGDF